MANSGTGLGPLVRIYGTSPALLQRAAVIAVLSFLFFMTTLLVFYMRQQVIYFVLSTAFLVVYIFTMIGWVMQKRNVVSIYQNGITYRQFSARWDEIKSVKADSKSGITLARNDGVSTTIATSVSDLDQIAVIIRNSLD